MKKAVLTFLFLSALSAEIINAQLPPIRYISEVFTSVDVTSDVTYGTNVDFITSKTVDIAKVTADITAIKTAMATGNPIPAAYYDPRDQSTDIKVMDLKMDVYEPTGDHLNERPVVIFIHTGIFLPPVINQSPLGEKTDSAAVELCKRLAKRGFVAISINYRLGWNPLSTDYNVRKSTLINAVYRAVHDAKQAVRYLKKDASTANTYKINTGKIALWGESSGGYVALTYATLDKVGETEISKFLQPSTRKSYIDPSLVGDINGFGGALNLYQNNGFSSDIHICISMGGAIPDTSWLETGDVPMISFQCIRDPFAPYDEQIVVVPTTLDPIVEVQGSNVFMAKANVLDNNNSYTSRTYTDPITLKARSMYGKTYDYILPTQPKITLNTNLEGHYPFLRPKGATLFQNENAPWQWWDPTGKYGRAIPDPRKPGVTAHQVGLYNNPDMSSQKGGAYLDTMLWYATPRIVYSLELFSLNEYSLEGKVELFPNPVQNKLRITVVNDVNLENVEILDITGKLILDLPLSEGQSEFSVNTLKRGIYIVKIRAREGVLTRKVIKS